MNVLDTYTEQNDETSLKVICIKIEAEPKRLLKHESCSKK